MTNSRPAAATQKSKKVFCYFQRRMPFLPQPSLFPGLETGSEYAGLHTPRLGYLLTSDVKFHEIFCPEIFHEIFLKY